MFTFDITRFLIVVMKCFGLAFQFSRCIKNLEIDVIKLKFTTFIF